MDAEIRRSVVPAEFRRSFMEALCCDCHATTRTKYHIIGLKCGKCGSYNTVPAGPLERRPHSGQSRAGVLCVGGCVFVDTCVLICTCHCVANGGDKFAGRDYSQVGMIRV